MITLNRFVDALELRILIAVIGLIILGLMYYFGSRKPNITRSDYEEGELFQIDPTLEEEQKTIPAKALVKSDTKNHGKVITLFLHAKDGLQFDWHQIKDAAHKAGLEYSDDHLFYRYRRIGSEKEMLFLVANMLKPGIFDVDMRTTGLAFIMQLPGTMSALDMWDTLFPVATRMCEILDGYLTDDNHSAFSRQRIASMREEMRQFEINNP